MKQIIYLISFLLFCSVAVAEDPIIVTPTCIEKLGDQTQGYRGYVWFDYTNPSSTITNLPLNGEQEYNGYSAPFDTNAVYTRPVGQVNYGRSEETDLQTQTVFQPGYHKNAFKVLVRSYTDLIYIVNGTAGGGWANANNIECPVDCNGVVNGEAVIDECGVCGGDNSTCMDCHGVPNGTAEIDECGVCGGDNSTCRDCHGEINGQAIIDSCGVCGGDNSTCKDCKGIPNGTAEIDQCGVCGGQNNTCLDCAGTPNGTARMDQCGVCGGNNSCICLGAVDMCGACNGNNSCVDCLGIPNGGTIVDSCGVCGGDSSSCRRGDEELPTLIDTAPLKKEYVTSVNRFVSRGKSAYRSAYICKPSLRRTVTKKINLLSALPKRLSQNLKSIGAFVLDDDVESVFETADVTNENAEMLYTQANKAKKSACSRRRR